MYDSNIQILVVTVYSYIYSVGLVASININIAAILPQDERRLFSMKHAAPAIEYAIEHLKNNTDLVNNHTFKVRYGDTNCLPGLGMNEAFEFYINKQVDVFLGPVCDFVLAPVARQTMFWNIPLLSVGAFAKQFNDNRLDEFRMLSRVGPVNFNSMSNAYLDMVKYLNWNKFKIIYEESGQDEYMDGMCYLAASAIHFESSQSLKHNMSHDHIKLEGHVVIEDILKLEVGLRYGVTFQNVDCINVNIGSILPATRQNLFPIQHAIVAIEYAIEFLQNNTDILHGHSINVRYGDTSCIEAKGMNEAINFYSVHNATVFFGPVCDFVVAVVARQAVYWNTPIVTVGALAQDFMANKMTEYNLLTRVGPVTFDSVAKSFLAVSKFYNWIRFKILYEDKGQDEYMESVCFLTAKGLHLESRATMKPDNYKLEANYDIESILKSEVGKSYSEPKKWFGVNCLLS